MKSVITGGTGMIGRELVDLMFLQEEDFLLTSRRAPDADEPRARWKPLDLRTGEGIAEAIEGADAVFHLASDTKSWDAAVDVAGTRRLLEVATEARVKHFIFISIVGADQIPLKYYRVKTQAEQVVARSGLPYTILRATQFHPFIDQIFRRLLPFPVGILPKKVKIQPVATPIVAQKLYDIYQTGPRNTTLNLGGPEVLEMGEMARLWAESQGKRKWIAHLPLVGEYRKALQGGALTCGEKAEGSLTWREWLRESYR